MRYLLFGDVQATEGHERCFTNPSVPLQQYRVKLLYQKLSKLCDEYAVDAVIDLGDTTDDRTSIPIPTVDTVLEGISKLPVAEENFKLIGNHEQWVRDGNVHLGKLFSSHFNVISTPEARIIDNTVFLLVPFIHEDHTIEPWVQEKVRSFPDKKVILFGHFKVVGSRLNSGVAQDGVPISAFRGIDLSLLGHIHKPQTVGNNVHYVGSPFQQNFGEAGEDKRVALLDTEDCSVQWIPLEGFPTYNLVSFNKFQELVQPTSENRFRVLIKNHIEAEKFYSHPLSERAEAIYDYGVEDALVRGQEEFQEITLSEALKAYLDLFPPQTKGITLDPSTMLSYGLQIAGGD